MPLAGKKVPMFKGNPTIIPSRRSDYTAMILLGCYHANRKSRSSSATRAAKYSFLQANHSTWRRTRRAFPRPRRCRSRYQCCWRCPPPPAPPPEPPLQWWWARPPGQQPHPPSAFPLPAPAVHCGVPALVPRRSGGFPRVPGGHPACQQVSVNCQHNLCKAPRCGHAHRTEQSLMLALPANSMKLNSFGPQGLFQTKVYSLLQT